MKKLYRSEANKNLFGVVGGLGEYFGVDPVVLRLVWVLVVLASGVFPGVIVYLIAALIVPQKSK